MKELDPVLLSMKVATSHMPVGAVGAVVALGADGTSALVEFVDAVGTTIALDWFPVGVLLPYGGRGVAIARQRVKNIRTRSRTGAYAAQSFFAKPKAARATAVTYQ